MSGIRKEREIWDAMDKNVNDLSSEEEAFIVHALQRWSRQTGFEGDVMEFFGVAWEAWEEGRRLGIGGMKLRQRIIWRLQDAQRSRTCPLNRFRGPLEGFGEFEGGYPGDMGPGELLEALQDWAIGEWPDFSPIWKGEVSIAEVRNLKKAKMGTVWYLADLGGRNCTGEAGSEALALEGRRLVLNAVRRMRDRLRTYGIRDVLRGKRDGR